MDHLCGFGSYFIVSRSTKFQCCFCEWNSFDSSGASRILFLEGLSCTINRIDKIIVFQIMDCINCRYNKYLSLYFVVFIYIIVSEMDHVCWCKPNIDIKIFSILENVGAQCEVSTKSYKYVLNIRQTYYFCPKHFV